MASTIVSWGLTLALGLVVAYCYNPQLFTKFLSQPVAAVAPVIPDAVRPSNKRSKSKKSVLSKVAGDDNSAPTSSNEAQVSKKRKIASAPTEKTVTTQTAQGERTKPSRVDDGQLGDKEFAAQLARTQAGTNLQKSDNDQSKKGRRSAKQSQATQFQPSDDPSAEVSSANGQDADDDMSPVATPSEAVTNGHTPRAGDVSDMLGAPAAKPTTLRLTSIPDTNKDKKKSAAKPFEPVKPKKSAQKERDRQLREEADRKQEALKQQQLRTARMAGGTSNQTKANNFSSTANAWQSSKEVAAAKVAPSGDAPLLDTFDPNSSTAARPRGAVQVVDIPGKNAGSAAELKAAIGEDKASAVAAAPSREGPTRSDSSWADEMSEQDQIKLLKSQQEDDAWESVASKKSKKKTKQENDTASEGSVAAHKTAPSMPKPQSNGHFGEKSKKPESVNRFVTIENKTQGLADADWEA